MTARIPLALTPNLRRSALHLCHLWAIARTDGTTLRFTDHSNELEYEGNTYTPVGGADASATQKQDGIQEANKSLQGVVLTSDAITFDDLRAGRYRDAVITETLVDWTSPWAGAVMSMTWRVIETRWDGERFDCELAGLTTLLRQPKGDVYSRPCRWTLGEAYGVSGTSGCKVNVALMTLTNQQVAAVNTQRLDFDTNISTVKNVAGSTIALVDGWFDFGVLTWVTGNNAGTQSEVKQSFATDARLTLQLKTPFDIQVSDQFNIYPGCPKTKDVCKSKFSNIQNYGGFPTIPGSDAMFETPDAK